MCNRLLSCMSILLFLLEILILYDSAYAATCTADCGAGRSVTCTGPSCGAADKVGCAAFDEAGKELYRKDCKDPDLE